MNRYYRYYSVFVPQWNAIRKQAWITGNEHFPLYIEHVKESEYNGKKTQKSYERREGTKGER